MRWVVEQHSGSGFDDGLTYAMTLGEFIALIVDSGPDPMVKFRVVNDEPPDEDGKFVRHIEISLVPDGYVRERASDCHRVHKVLKAMLDAELVT